MYLILYLVNSSVPLIIIKILLVQGVSSILEGKMRKIRIILLEQLLVLEKQPPDPVEGGENNVVHWHHATIGHTNPYLAVLHPLLTTPWIPLAPVIKETKVIFCKISEKK